MKTMRVAITSMGRDLESLVSPSFGQSPFILVVDIDESTKNYDVAEVIQNTYLYSGGRGVMLAQLLLGKNISALITGNVGGNAYTLLKQNGIRILNGVGLTVRNAIEKFLRNELNELEPWGRWGRR